MSTIHIAHIPPLEANAQLKSMMATVIKKPPEHSNTERRITYKIFLCLDYGGHYTGMDPLPDKLYDPGQDFFTAFQHPLAYIAGKGGVIRQKNLHHLAVSL